MSIIDLSFVWELVLTPFENITRTTVPQINREHDFTLNILGLRFLREVILKLRKYINILSLPERTI